MDTGRRYPPEPEQELRLPVERLSVQRLSYDHGCRVSVRRQQRRSPGHTDRTVREQLDLRLVGVQPRSGEAEVGRWRKDRREPDVPSVGRSAAGGVIARTLERRDTLSQHVAGDPGLRFLPGFKPWMAWRIHTPRLCFVHQTFPFLNIDYTKRTSPTPSHGTKRVTKSCVGP